MPLMIVVVVLIRRVDSAEYCSPRGYPHCVYSSAHPRYSPRSTPEKFRTGRQGRAFCIFHSGSQSTPNKYCDCILGTVAGHPVGLLDLVDSAQQQGCAAITMLKVVSFSSPAGSNSLDTSACQKVYGLF